MNNEKELIHSLQTLKDSVDKDSSLRWTFVKGVVRGVGAVVGASVVAGLVLGWAAATFDQASNLPLIGKYFQGVSGSIQSGQ